MDKLVPTLILGVCSLAAFYYMFLYAINDFMRPTEEKCFASHPKPDPDGIFFAATGVRAVDSMACFGSAFFTAIIESPSGLFILREFCGVAFPAFLLMGIESQREGARGLMLLFPLHAFLCVGVAYGVAFPLVWVIGYWWRPKHPAKNATYIGDTKVKAVVTVVFAIVASYIAICMPSLKMTHNPWLAPVMLLPVLLSPVFYFAPQGQHAVLPAGHGSGASTLLDKFEQLSHPRRHAFATIAGASAVMHGWAMLDFFTNPNASLLPAIFNSGPQWRQEHFLFVDIMMCVLGCLAFLWMEPGPVGGVKGVVEFLGVAVVFGPGTAFGHCLQAREVWLIAQEAEEGQKEE